ncbi:hypothetical protein, partial [Neisseria meningitidis]|uniref:hypothetical protein n=1 Tax=Neisseria meningitidis TaxID=487 RepID=UPI000FC9FBCF
AYWPFSVRESCTSNANPPPSENLSDGIFYQSSHIFYQGCKTYPKQQKSFHRHSRKSGNLERKI